VLTWLAVKVEVRPTVAVHLLILQIPVVQQVVNTAAAAAALHVDTRAREAAEPELAD
jgi:hypothetical protein